MSFNEHKTIIDEGDTVILYLTINSMHAIDVTQQIKNKKGELVENVFQTNFGALKVKDLIGKSYGSKVCFLHEIFADLRSQTLKHTFIQISIFVLG